MEQLPRPNALRSRKRNPVKPQLIIPVVALAIVAAGCGSAPSGAPGADNASPVGRPQRLIQPAAAPDPNLFAGEWGSKPGYVVNDWDVKFGKDGRVQVKGPGIEAEGLYKSSGEEAKVVYTERDGGEPEPELDEATFRVSGDHSQIEFSTGLPLDPPVQLTRVGDVP